MMDLKRALRSSYWQLIVVYAVFVMLIAFGYLYKFTYHFEVFALIIGGIGVYAFSDRTTGGKGETHLDPRLVHGLLFLGIVLIVVFRTLPYFGNAVPIGYDAGIYKFGMESFAEKGFGISAWEKASFSPGFLYLMFLAQLVLSSSLLLTWGFVLLFVILGISVFMAAKEFFGERAAIISFLIYAVSAVQFKVFSFMYYKNLLALIFLVLALYFLRKEHWTGFVLFGFLVGMFHLPTFFVFGLGFLLYTGTHYKDWRINFVMGAGIVFLTGIGYFGFWDEAVIPLIKPVALSFTNPGQAPGTFISFLSYQFSTLMYVPFAILGFGLLAVKKRFNLVWSIALVCALIVYFQFFFFNRFIIHLDLMLILLAGLGFNVAIDEKKKLGVVLLVLMLVSSGFVLWSEARETRPLVNTQTLDLISSIQTQTAEDARVMALTSKYAPPVLGWSGRETIAPGMFEHDLWNKEQWETFWQTQSVDETKGLVDMYGEGEIYLFAGTEGFNNPCFNEFLKNEGGVWYHYVC